MEKTLVQDTLSVTAILAGLSAFSSGLVLARLAVGAWQGWECATVDMLYSVSVATAGGALASACALGGGALGGHVRTMPRGGVCVVRGEGEPPAGETCGLCTDGPAEAVLRPCGHAGGCLACTLGWAARCPGGLTCPLCRAAVARVEYLK